MKLFFNPGEAIGKYGFTFIKDLYITKNYKRYVLLKCRCGKRHKAQLYAVRCGTIKSCGCKRSFSSLQSNKSLQSILKEGLLIK